MSIALVEVQVFSSAPFRNKIRNGRPVGRLFLDFGGAKARCFLGGMKKLPHLESADFCFVVGIADTLCVNNSWYNRLAHKLSGKQK